MIAARASDPSVDEQPAAAAVTSERVLLTNWDALQAAEMVSKGAPVTFVGDDAKKKTPAKRRHRG